MNQKHRNAIARNLRKDQGPTNSQLRGIQTLEITENTVNDIVTELREQEEGDGLTIDGIAVGNYYTLQNDSDGYSVLDEMYNSEFETPFEEFYNSHPDEAIDLYDYFD